jgi:uncharacterized RDD family membrane protein YckC
MTPETLTIRDHTYEVATWPLRIAAKVIDFGICYGVFVYGVPLVFVVFPEALASLLMFVVLAACAWWWLASDGVLHGAGLGKLLMGLRLVHRRHGSAPSQGQAVLRQLKYSMFLFLWGLIAHGYDNTHGLSQEDGFVTVKAKRPHGYGAASDAPPPVPANSRPLNVEALGSFLSRKYAHKDDARPNDDP